MESEQLSRYSLVLKFPFTSMKLTLATRITLSRLVFAIASIVLLYTFFPYHYFVSLACFVIAIVTDFADGRVARKRKEVSPLGIMLDPLVDKLTVLSLLIALVDQTVVVWWMVILILFRELTVTSFRDYAISKGVSIPSVLSGKLKSVLQYLAIILALLTLGLAEVISNIGTLFFIFNLTWYVLLASIIVGYYGMIEIFRKNWKKVLG